MATFPTFEDGAAVHLPFTQVCTFRNCSVDMPHGWRYSYNLRPAALHRWRIEYSLSDADVLALRTFFDLVQGSFGVFDFTDPDTGVDYAKCRLDMDELVIEYVEPNVARAVVSIVELV